jgi:hypothetical protein
LVVYNPLPWKRSGVVTMNVAGTPLADRDSGMWLVKEDGKRSLDNYDNDGTTLRLSVKQLPSHGYRTYGMNPALIDRFTGPSVSPTLENAFLKIDLDPPRGTIKSVVSKSTGRELVDAAAPFGFGQHLYERFDSNQVAAYVKAYVKINADWAINELGKPSMPPAGKAPYRAASPKGFGLRFERSYGTRVAVMEAAASAEVPYAVSTKVLLYRDEPYFDLEMTIHAKPADPWPEAGWICLPFKIAAPRFRLGRQGSIIDPTKDIVVGANRNLCDLDTGVAVFETEGRGVGVCPIDNPLISLGEPGCWKYSLDFLPNRPAVHVNLFNNQWTTNFRLWNAGTWTARVRIWAFDHYDAESSLIAPSLEARFPLQAAFADGPGGTLPATQTGLELGRQGVLVTAFGPNPDGSGTLLRLWELAGTPGECQVRLPKGLAAKTAQPVNLRGQPLGKAVPVTERAFVTELRAFAPASFVIGP